MTYSSTRQNLSVDVQGSNDGAKPGGAPIERIITVRNRGSEVANVDLWIRSNDAKSEPLLRWCTLLEANTTTNGAARGSRDRPQQREQGFSGLRLLQVEPQEDREVVLRLDVPPQVEPGFYSYDIVAQAPQYPGEQSQRTQQLRVLTSGQDVGLRSEPSWSVEPATSSEGAYSLQAGTALRIKVMVSNRSDAVDRFYLSCPELDPTWFDAPSYPENNPYAPGLITRADGLMLNPGESGSILLEIHPPAYTPAGHYSSTLRLTSFNRTNLVLLDILYLKVEINDRMIVDLQPPVQKHPAAIESFHLFLSNSGNIIRTLGIEVKDKDDLFAYSLTSDRIQLSPGQSQTVRLIPTSKKWWRRDWQGKEQAVDFEVNLFDAQPDQNKSADRLYLPEHATGKILWQSRPEWILQFLRLLLIGLLLAGAVGLAYWLLRELVVKPSEQPKILKFSTTEESYQAGSGNPIRLDWKISNFDWKRKPKPSNQPGQPAEQETNAQATVTYYASDGSVLFNKNYPLQQLTSLQKTCETGTYQPNVVLQLIRRLYLLKPEIATISCTGIASLPDKNIAFLAGEYQVKLEVLPQRSSTSTASAQNPQSFDSQRLTNIKLAPTPLPEILYFYSKTPIYRQLSPTGSTTNGAGALPQYPNPPIKLNWVISDTKEIAALELNTVHITANGAIENRQVQYAVQNGIPVGLAGLCRSQGTQLLCENVPTQATTPGKYTFTLSLVMSPDRGASRITKNSEPIEIRPPLPNILSFMVNNADVLKNPQLVQMINPARGPVHLNLTWQVADPDRVKIELLPAPGMLSSADKSLTYLLSPTPGSTTLTLQVTNQTGEVVSRSVVIQTAAFPSSPAPASASPGGQSASSAAPGGASGAADSAAPSEPIAPDQPPPLELPPRAN